MKDFPILKKIKNHPYYSFALLLLTLIILVLIFNICFRLIQKEIIFYNLDYKTEKISKYPLLINKYQPYISAKGAIVMDLDSRVVLFSKNPDLRFSSASTAKLVTALTALEFFKMKDELTVKTNYNQGTVLGLNEGEKMSFENLLYAMLLPSANDAAIAIAQNYPGGSSVFVAKMNEIAARYNLRNSHFADPAGLNDELDYTTAFDLANLAAVVQKNIVIRNITNTKQKTITDKSGNKVYFLENRNKLLGINGVDGLKTGTTEDAGEVLITTKLEKYIDNITKKTYVAKLIFVVMGSLDRYSDTQTLINLVSGNVNYLTIQE